MIETESLSRAMRRTDRRLHAVLYGDDPFLRALQAMSIRQAQRKPARTSGYRRNRRRFGYRSNPPRHARDPLVST